MRVFAGNLAIETFLLRSELRIQLQASFPTVNSSSKKILYCRCAFSQVVPDDVKNEVLRKLSESNTSFECVADLCEMSARKDERLKKLIGEGEKVQIAACYPRAVRWLFHAAGTPLAEDETVEILNMRDQSADEIGDQLLGS